MPSNITAVICKTESTQVGHTTWWCGSNMLVSINGVVALRGVWLVLGWVTICRWVNHLGM